MLFVFLLIHLCKTQLSGTLSHKYSCQDIASELKHKSLLTWTHLHEAPVLTKSSCTAHRKGRVNLKSTKHSCKDRFKWTWKKLELVAYFLSKIFFGMECLLTNFRVFFLSGALIFYIFSTFINIFSVNIERNFVGFISGLLLRKKIPFSQQLHCVQQVVMKMTQHGWLSHQVKVGTSRSPGKVQYSRWDFW